jgi:hypothetical protein
MHFRFGAQSSRSSSVIFNNPKVCTRPEGVIDDVFSVPPRLVQNFLKTHQMRLRLIPSISQCTTYT